MKIWNGSAASLFYIDTLICESCSFCKEGEVSRRFAIFYI